MQKNFLFALLLLCLVFPACRYAGDIEKPSEKVKDSLGEAKSIEYGMDQEDQINLFCLRKSYPEISDMVHEESGDWLIFSDGRRVLYAAKPWKENTPEEAEADVRSSMAQPYVLEPIRPETPAGYAPGRVRSYALLNTVYGDTLEKVKKGLISTSMLAQSFFLSGKATEAFKQVVPKLEKAVVANPGLLQWLHNSGSFLWRTIAGEKRLSPHSYGIAIDLSADHGATYWKWSKERPHPLQKSYPSEIVSAFEAAGFIWGGKWYEYDLMHFEYRPEIICKARLKATQNEMLEKNPEKSLEKNSANAQ